MLPLMGRGNDAFERSLHEFRLASSAANVIAPGTTARAAGLTGLGPFVTFGS